MTNININNSIDSTKIKESKLSSSLTLKDDVNSIDSNNSYNKNIISDFDDNDDIVNDEDQVVDNPNQIDDNDDKRNKKNLHHHHHHHRYKHFQMSPINHHHYDHNHQYQQQHSLPLELIGLNINFSD